MSTRASPPFCNYRHILHMVHIAFVVLYHLLSSPQFICILCLPPGGAFLLISPAVIMIYSSITVMLAEACHVTVVIIMSCYPISSSLAETCHYSVAVVMPCDTICSALTKSSTHTVFLRLLIGYLLHLHHTLCH